MAPSGLAAIPPQKRAAAKVYKDQPMSWQSLAVPSTPPSARKLVPRRKRGPHDLDTQDGRTGSVVKWPGRGERAPAPPRQPRQFETTLEQFTASPFSVTPRLRPVPSASSVGSVLSGAASARGKPKLLQRLQAQLDGELARHQAEGGDDAGLLAAYGECWDRLADEFTLYRPLLAAVKAEYMRFISHYDGEIARLQPTVAQIDAREADRSAVCAAAERDCAAKREALRQEVREAQQLKKDKEAELKSVRCAPRHATPRHAAPRHAPSAATTCQARLRPLLPPPCPAVYLAGG